LCDGKKDCDNGEGTCVLLCSSSEISTPPFVCTVISDEKDCPTKKDCGLNPKNCEQICVTTFDGKEGCACRLGFILLPNENG
jgi:hypothetical protein